MGEVKNVGPPKWIVRFFRWFCNPELAEVLEGDLLEQFNSQVATLGVQKARFLYVLYVLRFFHPAFIRRKLNSNSHPYLITTDMIRNYLKTSFRNLVKNKTYSLINIFGLSVGLAAFTLIAIFVRHELSYDRYNQNVENIYRIVRSEYTCSAPPMAPTLKSEIPEIQNASRFIRSENALISFGDNYFVEDEYFWTDNELFDILSFNFVKGNIETVLKDPTDFNIQRQLTIIAHNDLGYEIEQIKA